MLPIYKVAACYMTNSVLHVYCVLHGLFPHIFRFRRNFAIIRIAPSSIISALSTYQVSRRYCRYFDFEKILEGILENGRRHLEEHSQPYLHTKFQVAATIISILKKY